MGEIVAFCSGKGGTGKSTATAALALSLSDMGKSVICIDLDSGLRCLDTMFGIDDSITLDLGDILAGREVIDAVYEIPKTAIKLIPAPINAEDMDFKLLERLINLLSENNDFVLLDMPAGISHELISAVYNCGARFITVCTPDLISIKDAAAVNGSLPEGSDCRLIINRFSYELIKSGVYRNIDDMIDISATRLLGILPHCDELMLLSVNHSLKKRGRPKKATRRIAERLCGNTVELPSPKKI